MKVKELLEHIERNNIPMDAEVFIQRIEDFYVKVAKWEVIRKEGFHYNRLKFLNEKVESGEFNNKEKYPLIENPEDFRYSEEELEQAKEQYFKSYCPVKYPDDNNLYIDAHY